MFNEKKAAAAQPGELYEPAPLDREEVDLREGTVVVFSDCHWLPDDPKSTAHRALLILIQELNPELLIANGDCLDFASISRHDPIGWERRPSVASEIAVVQKYLGEIAEAAPQSRLYYPQGNHEARFSARLAKNAQEYGDLPGFDLSYYFPDWQFCWSLWINPQASIPTIVQHRMAGGVTAGARNIAKTGTSVISGHSHFLTVSAASDFRGPRYGCQTGCLASVSSSAFKQYTECAVTGWTSGFAVLSVFSLASALVVEIRG